MWRPLLHDLAKYNVLPYYRTYTLCTTLEAIVRSHVRRLTSGSAGDIPVKLLSPVQAIEASVS